MNAQGSNNTICNIHSTNNSRRHNSETVSERRGKPLLIPIYPSVLRCAKAKLHSLSCILQISHLRLITGARVTAPFGVASNDSTAASNHHM